MIIFLHHQKAAGTTLHALMDQEYGRKTHLSVDAVREALRRGPIPAAGNHWHYGVHREMGLARHDCHYITVLRHPLHRLISAYYYLAQRPDPHPDQAPDEKRLIDAGLDLVGWLAWRTRHLGWSNEQAQRMVGLQHGEWFWEDRAANLDTAVRNLEDCDLVGTQERFGEFVGLCRARFGWLEIEVPQENQATPPAHPTLPEWVVERFMEDNAEDFLLWRHADAMLTRQLAEVEAAGVEVEA